MPTTALYFIFIAVEIVFALFIFLYLALSIYSSFMGSAYVPSKRREIHEVLRRARLKKGQLFIDLGCGDGRVVGAAVRHYQVKGAGYDINPLLVLYARLRYPAALFKTANIFDVSVAGADIIYIFLMPAFIKRLAPQLKRQAKRNALVISHGFRIFAWEKYLTSTLKHTPFPTYFYRLP